METCPTAAVDAGKRRLALFFLFASVAGAVIVDRIAIVVENTVIKDSDIERDLRMTDFLNGDKLDLSEPKRKASAQRLIDQRLIKHEIEVGSYERATPQDVQELLYTVKKQRFHDSDVEYRASLQTYRITDPQLQKQLTWQITVLHFIDERFRPAVLVPDEDIAKLQAQKPGASKDEIREQLTGERVNEAFEAWIQGARKRSEIEYHEAGLQ